MNINIDSISAVNIAQIALSNTQADFMKFVESIASGSFSQISPSDLYVSNNLNTNVMSGYAAIENAQQGVNLTSVADSALANVGDSISRIKELATQAANDTYSDAQRQAIQAEIDELSAGIEKTLASVNYNGKEVLNVVSDDTSTKAENINFQVGTGSTQESVSSYDPNIQMPEEMKFDVTSSQSAREAMELADDMLSTITTKRTEIAAVQTGLIDSIGTNMTSVVNNQASYSQIADTDYASAMIGMMQNQFTQETLIAVLKSGFETQSNVLDLISGVS